MDSSNYGHHRYPARRDRRVHRARGRAAGGREPPVLRPSARVRAHRRRARRGPRAGLGGPLGRDGAARRRGGPVPLRAAGRARRSAGANADMAVIREHLANKPLGLHSDLQSEVACVGNFPLVLVLHALGTPEQRELIEPMIRGEVLCGFGLTEPEHGSDATWLETPAVRDGDDWVINGRKRFNTGMHRAHYDLVFARTSGEPGAHRGITAFLVPTATPGLEVLYQHWTFNMPSDHAEVALTRRARAGDGDRGRGGPRARTPPCCSCTRTGSARRRRAWARRSSASTRASPTRGADRVRQAAGGQPGDPVPARRAAHRVRAAARAGPQRRRSGWTRDGAAVGLGAGLDVQLPRQPARVRCRRPRHPGPRRHRLHPRQAVRAHLPPPPPLPDHRGLGGDPDADDRPRAVRLRAR